MNDYPASVRYLYALGNELKPGAKFGLDRMRALLTGLGNPERNQRFVHVAGTNGKGSTCAILAEILKRSGFRTGLYTSPHLIEPTERIQINGVAVDASRFAAAFQTVHETAERLISEGSMDAHPSYFETVTAMAFLIFREACDISVIEVGLGGRLDATNVIAPQLCVITPIAYDHESFLGNTIESIAAEKAGILKPAVPVVVARQSEAAGHVIAARAKELDCPVSRTVDHCICVNEINLYGSQFELDGITYECNLPGRHQIENASTAIVAARLLDLSVPAIQAGVHAARWPGRLEYISQNPDLVLDGAHNPAGAAALASYIREFCSNRPVWVVYGAMRDKAIDEVTAQLFPLAQRLILTMPDYSRALRPEAILAINDHPNATVTHSLPAAIKIARAAPSDAIVFFTGSLFVVGEARRLLLS